MKKYLTFAIACIVAVFSLSSCLNDDDDNSLTSEEINTIIYELSNEYYGYIIPVVGDQTTNTYEKKDSAMAYVSVHSDTTITISEFPVSAIADKVTMDTDLKEALLNTGNAFDLTGRYYPANINPATALVGYLSFELTYPDGEIHEITLAPDSYNYSYITYSSTSSQFYFQFLPSAIYVDGTLLESFSSLDTLYYLIS
jgi:hypothetical protein